MSRTYKDTGRKSGRYGTFAKRNAIRYRRNRKRSTHYVTGRKNGTV